MTPPTGPKGHERRIALNTDERLLDENGNVAAIRGQPQHVNVAIKAGRLASKIHETARNHFRLNADFALGGLFQPFRRPAFTIH
jgi:hypothetical protein